MYQSQRGAKGHPWIGAMSSGGCPSSVASRSCSISSRRGTDRSSPTVYGWRGSRKMSVTVPVSMILPAYITLTLST